MKHSKFHLTQSRLVKRGKEDCGGYWAVTVLVTCPYLVQIGAMHVRGVGSKAALLLASLATHQPALLQVVRASLAGADLGCLCSIAAAAAAAGDMDAARHQVHIHFKLFWSLGSQ